MVKRDSHNILAVNSGSSSLKVSLFQGERLLDARVATNLRSVEEGLRFIFDALKLKEIQAIGHRIVYGGSRYTDSVRIDATFLKEFSGLSELDPLHNAPCLAGIQGCLSYFGADILQVGVFDTTFYRDLPSRASHYAIPQEIAKKYAIRRYGFHGISHAFLWNAYVQEKGDPNARIITMHLGSGCSMTAIQGGKPLDTSMGFTPAEGLVMATRAGDIDASLVEYLGRREGKSASEIMELLNRHSGLLGVSGVSADMSVLLSICKTNESARLAIELFCYRVIKYLGAYIAALEGVDAFIFSAGIGENSPEIRERIVSGMEWFGVKLDAATNKGAVHLSPGAVHKISAAESTVEVYVIGTDENAFIAKEVERFLG